MICLIRPPCVETFRISSNNIGLPLGLAYIAAAVDAAGKDVHVIDSVAQAPTTRTRYYRGYLVGLTIDQITARIPDAATSVGISILFTHEWPFAVQLIKAIKAARPDLCVILGGEHVTSMPEFCLATSAADILVLGEGEEILVEVLDCLDAGRDLGPVDGIAYRRDGKIAVNRRRARNRDIDNIAMPAWHMFDISAYLEHGFSEGVSAAGITIPVLGTRGCPYQCTFCSSPNNWLPRWYARDPVKVVDEIEHLMTTYGATNFPFQDLTATLERKWVIGFCREVLDRGLDITWQFPTGTRCEVIDEEVSELLRQSGMKLLSFSPEAASEVTRQRIKKKLKTETLVDSVTAAVSKDLNTSLTFVLGFPHDTEDDMMVNVPFVKDMVGRGVADICVIFFMALPGTELFYSLYDAGKVKIDRKYFRHLLHGLAFKPDHVYSEHVGFWTLLKIKYHMYLAFYGGRSGQSFLSSLGGSSVKALGGMFADEHQTRLQTAVRFAFKTAWQTFLVQFGARWITRHDEDEMFSRWDEIFRDIRTQIIDQGHIEKAPSDTSEIHKTNIIKTLRRYFEIPRTLANPGSSDL
ncbi:MAG: radical SAM protein [Magnetovibrio sp.]|nr:radical SAM protein [Magnetovibrio sp.]